jgi:hypothetical protein
VIDKPIQHRLGGALFFKQNTHRYGSGINFQWWFKEWSLIWNSGSWNQRTYPEPLAFFRSSHETHSFFENKKNPKQEVLTNPRTTQHWLKPVLAGYCFFFFIISQVGYFLFYIFLDHTNYQYQKKLIKKLDPLLINFIIKIIPTFVNVFGYVFGNNCWSCVRVSSQIPTLRITLSSKGRPYKVDFWFSFLLFFSLL